MPLYLKRYLNEIRGVKCERKSLYAPPDTWGEFDATLYVDWSQDSFPHVPSVVVPKDKPSLCWQSDTHWNKMSLNYRLSQATLFDRAAFVHRDGHEMFTTEHPDIPSVWMPCAADYSVYHPPVNIERLNPFVHRAFQVYSPKEFMDKIEEYHLSVDAIPSWDVSFVGYVGDPKRESYLEQLFEAVPNFTFSPGLFFEDALKVYHRSAMVFNVSVRGDLNMRTFEVMSSRACLLTDRQLGMDTLGLRHREHCLIYDSIEQAIELAKEWKDESMMEKRRDMARRGWEWVMANHTYWHRARTALELLGLSTYTEAVPVVRSEE